MTELIGIITIILASFVTLVALLTTLAFLIPNRAERARQTIAARPGRSFLIGLVNLLFFGALAAIFSQGGDGGGLLGLIILLILLALAFIGLTGLVLFLRPRFYPPHEESAYTLLATTTRTSALLTTALLAPGIGWFALAPILLTVGLGAGIIALIRHKTVPASLPPAN